MNYSNAVQQAKAERSDHRKARAVAGSAARRTRKRDSKNFVTVEREHDPLRRFGGSLKAVYFDSDGDGNKDSYGRVYRGGAAHKPGVIIPTFGPPKAGPSGLQVEEFIAVPPASGPSGLAVSVIAPASGPSDLETSVIAPASGPSDLETSVIAPAAGPSDLETSVLAPASGPTGLIASEGIPDAPASGPSGLDATVNIPNSGPSGLDATVNAPASGPTGLDATVNAPASGPTDLSAGVAAPASGPTGLDATVNAPASGPTGLNAVKATLNITIEDSQDTLVANTPATGTIEYASDVGYLFIYDGTEWHRINGA